MRLAFTIYIPKDSRKQCSDNSLRQKVKEMIERREIMKETLPYSIHLSIIKKWKNDDRLDHYNNHRDRDGELINEGV